MREVEPGYQWDPKRQIEVPEKCDHCGEGFPVHELSETDDGLWLCPYCMDIWEKEQEPR